MIEGLLPAALIGMAAWFLTRKSTDYAAFTPFERAYVRRARPSRPVPPEESQTPFEKSYADVRR